jgi:hypothetical protein
MAAAVPAVWEPIIDAAAVPASARHGPGGNRSGARAPVANPLDRSPDSRYDADGPQGNRR